MGYEEDHRINLDKKAREFAESGYVITGEKLVSMTRYELERLKADEINLEEYDLLEIGKKLGLDKLLRKKKNKRSWLSYNRFSPNNKVSK